MTIRCLALALLLACGGDSADPPLFPTDYATAYAEARNCRSSTDHDLHRIRVFASANAMTPYNDRTSAFPAGAILVKEEFSRTDDTCSGPVVEVTAMQRLDSGEWRWQRTNAALEPVDEDTAPCLGCHSACQDGHAGTCALP